ncbi:phosphatidyl-N-methylethanolamine N-methyltransferase [Pyrus ussuriensis x Pyrus communis]|uniref:Phosphatidyl-N-methylethanolamine N-methyltransferase n=1 Tax=Pyrus ussuriensis x Pyrus communis TaxID=2448454 RepID=A0A5N5GCS9_9ROSA|nr:phosphatidyl-N-methylethanolamine N-methyltransferase [Pyrus ussuriensis x Pyrus communis]
MGIAAAIGVLSPFPFYYWLWSYPQTWVGMCGKGRDPCKVMAYVSHFLKLIQFLSLFSVSTFSWPPPLYFWPLIAFGQFLNFRVYQLLGESGTYYGVRFGKNIPWVTEFPFGMLLLRGTDLENLQRHIPILMEARTADCLIATSIVARTASYRGLSLNYFGVGFILVYGIPLCV